MILTKKHLFSIPIASVTLRELPNILQDLINKKGQKTVFYINAHCINLAQNDEQYKTILQKADLVYSGGIGPIWASKILGKPLKDRTPTPDFIDSVFSLCQKNEWTIYLLGSEENVVKHTAHILSQKYPKIIVGLHNGYFSAKEEKKLITEINTKKPFILLVGMGSPKQEKWIEKHKHELNVSVFWAVGALFDVISQKVKRAPKWMQVIGLEWLYRLLQEPHRLWKRYLIGNMQFLRNIIKEYFLDRH